MFPDADPGEHPWNRSGPFNKMNRNRRGVCLDAKAPGGREVLDRLVADADLLSTTSRHAARARSASTPNASPPSTATWPPSR